MQCKKFREHLEDMLNARIDSLPALAERHREACAPCASLYRQLLHLRDIACSTPEPMLSPHSERKLLAQIVRAARYPSNGLPNGISSSISIFMRGLRWEPILLLGGLATACISLFLRFSEPQASQPMSFGTETDVQELLEEHAQATDSGIFYGSSQYAHFVLATEEE